MSPKASQEILQILQILRNLKVRVSRIQEVQAFLSYLQAALKSGCSFKGIKTRKKSNDFY